MGRRQRLSVGYRHRLVDVRQIFGCSFAVGMCSVGSLVDRDGSSAMARLGKPGDNDKLHVDGTEPLQFEEDIQASIEKCIVEAADARTHKLARSKSRTAEYRARHAADRAIGLMFLQAWRRP